MEQRQVNLSFSRTWYRGGGILNDDELIDRLCRGAELGDILVGQGRYTIQFRDAMLASVALGTGKVAPAITLPLWYLSSAATQKATGSGDREVMGALVIGSLIHELGHVIFTREAAGNLYGLFGVIYNIVEDIFIEAQLARGYADLAHFVDQKNDLLFPRTGLETALTWARGSGKPDRWTDVLVHWKRASIRGDSLFDDPYLEVPLGLLEEARTATSPRRRAAIAREILNYLQRADDDTHTGTDGPGFSDGDGDAPPPERYRPTEVAGIDEFYSQTWEHRAEVDALANEFVKERQLDQVGLTSVERRTDFQSTIVQLQAADGVEVEPLRIPAGLNLEYDDLGEWLQIQMTENRPHGEPSVRGPKLVGPRLTRIITDGKIFAYNVPQQVVRRLDVVILVDMSGSMEATPGTTKGVSRLIEALVAAREMYRTLEAAPAVRSVVVYGHTTGTELNFPELAGRIGYVPVVYQIAGPGEELFDEAGSQDTNAYGANADGLAIEEVSQLFANPRDAKIIIVLSDGLPSLSAGPSAELEVIETVAAARAKGIVVLSVSLDPSVVRNNDRLYGRDFNVDGTSNLGEQFRRAIEAAVEQLG